MLSVSTVRSAKGASAYFAADNYYTPGEAETSGEWFGKGAAALGLSGQVDKETFEALLKGSLPNGEQVGSPERHRAGVDLTFSLPKSWSLLALVGGDRRILDAYRAAVKETLGWADPEHHRQRIGLAGNARGCIDADDHARRRIAVGWQIVGAVLDFDRRRLRPSRPEPGFGGGRAVSTRGAERQCLDLSLGHLRQLARRAPVGREWRTGRRGGIPLGIAARWAIGRSRCRRRSGLGFGELTPKRAVLRRQRVDRARAVGPHRLVLGRERIELRLDLRRDRLAFLERFELPRLKDDRRFNLNPAGRAQTKKHRPIVPVNDLLHAWLCDTEEWLVCKERSWFDTDEQIERVEQISVKAVRSGWDTMRTHLGIPKGWGPKLVRHSMASELRKRRVDPWELAGQLGHRVLKTSEIYAIFDPDYLSTVQLAIADILSDLEKSCGAALQPTFSHVRCDQGALAA